MNMAQAFEIPQPLKTAKAGAASGVVVHAGKGWASLPIPEYIGDANGGVYRYTPDIGPSSTGSPASDAEGRALGQIVTIQRLSNRREKR